MWPFRKKFDKTVTRTKTRNFPVKPEKIKDFRNFKYHDNFMSLRGILPDRVDLRDTGYFNPIRDQGIIGSCTAMATGSLIEYLWNKKRDKIDLDISELYQYYYTRELEGRTQIDSGAYIINAIKTPFVHGFTTEEMWPYIVTDFDDKPSITARTSAVWFKRFLNDNAYYEIYSTKDKLQQVLADGYPIVFGAKVNQNFLDLDKAWVEEPKGDYKGGHCMLIVGYFYLDTELFWIIRNSWGEDWGAKGYAFMPEKFRVEYCFDYYTMRDFK